MYAPPYALRRISEIRGTVALQYAYSSLAPCRMMPPCSWSTPGRKPGTSSSVTIGMLKASHICTKRAAFSDASMSSTPARDCGWLATMPTTWPSSRASAQMMLRGPALVDLQVVAVVDDLLDDLAHVVRAVAVGRDQVQQRRRRAGRPGRRHSVGRRVLPVVLREHRQQVAHLLEAGLLVVVREVRHAGGLGVHVRAAQAVLGDLLAGHRLDHVRAGDEHLRGLADHEHEVRQRRGVGRAARARAEHHADLRDDARRPGCCAGRCRRSRRARRRPPGYGRPRRRSARPAAHRPRWPCP